jgi:hypothetical protein
MIVCLDCGWIRNLDERACLMCESTAARLVTGDDDPAWDTVIRFVPARIGRHAGGTAQRRKVRRKRR